MATASVLCLAQDHHGSQRPAVNLLRAADYAWRLLLQPLRREAAKLSAPGARLAVTVGHGQSKTVAVGAAQQQPVAVPRYQYCG